MREVNTTGGGDEGRFSRLRHFPAAGYAAAQVLVLASFVLVLFYIFSRINSLFAWDESVEGTGGVLIFVSVLTLPPALLVGMVDGLARRARSGAWRIAASVPVLILGCWLALVGTFFAASTSAGVFPNGGPDPFPLGPYLVALMVVEASLALSWGVASLVSRIGRGR